MIRIAFLLLVLMLAFGCSGDDDDDEPDAVASFTPPARPRAASTASPGETTGPEATLQSYEPVLQLKGVYRPPETTTATRNVELPERPASAFGPWNGTSVVVYDTLTGEAHDFGPGNLWLPAFGKNHLVFTFENEVYVVDLRTMHRSHVARGILAYFLGDNHIVINPGDNEFYAVHVETGEQLELDKLTAPLLQSMLSQRWGGAYQAKWSDARFAIRRVENPRAVCEQSGPEQRACLAEASSRWVVEDIWSKEVKLAFRADKVEPAGPSEIVIATLPLCPHEGWLTDCYEVLARLENESTSPGGQVAVEGTTNIFIVDLRTGEAEFIATATYNAATGVWPMKWPLVATDSYVVWTESFCGGSGGATRVYDRATGEIAELNTSEWVALAAGRLGLGKQGITAVLDPGTFEYLAVLPEMSGVSWSRDLRYAAVGQGFGRGGVCD